MKAPVTLICTAPGRIMVLSIAVVSVGRRTRGASLAVSVVAAIDPETPSAREMSTIEDMRWKRNTSPMRETCGEILLMRKVGVGFGVDFSCLLRNAAVA